MSHPKALAGWRVWYDLWDGQPLRQMNSWDNRWQDLPDDGIQGVMKFFEDGTRAVISGYDWYFAVKHPSGSLLISGNNDGPEETLRRYPGAVIKRGKHTTDEWAHLADKLMVDSNKVEGCKGC